MSDSEILLVDDDADLLQSTAILLADFGHSVKTAGNALEALAVLKATRSIKILLTDVIMPGGMNGFELAEKAKELNPNLRVIYTTGYSPVDLPGKSLHGSILLKPWSIEKLEQEIERCFTC